MNTIVVKNHSSTIPPEIYKYELAHEGRRYEKATLTLQKGCTILKAACIRNRIFIWALVDQNKEIPDEVVTFHIYGTGSAVKPEKSIEHEYIDTVFEMGGYLVWHIFKEVRK